MSTEVDFESLHDERLRAERVAFIQALRDVADFLESYPRAPYPNDADLMAYRSGEDFKEAVRHIGSFEKSIAGINDEVFVAQKQFGPIRYRVITMRESVCERVVVGKRRVAAKSAEPEHDEDVVEWKCGELLAAYATEEEEASK